TVPDMPESAIRHASVDYVVPLREIAPILERLVREPVTARPLALPGGLLELEGDEPGRPAEFVCPICQGEMTEAEFADFQIFRCHVGHAFSLQSVIAEQAESVERALWASTRALEEAVRLSERLAAGALGDTRERFLEKARAQQEDVRVLRRLFLNSNLLVVRDAQLAKSATPPRAESGNGHAED